MRDHTIVIACALSLTVGACGATRPDPAARRGVLLEADRAFAAATAERGVDGWVSYFAAEGTQFPPHGMARGHEEIRRRMAPVFADPDNTLRWEPTFEDVAASGDLGYTVGRWENATRATDGSTSVTARGSYVTIWRRQADGTWNVVVDIGNSDEVETPAAGAGN